MSKKKKKMPYEMKIQERNAKTEQINRLQRAFRKNLALCKEAKEAGELEPYLNLTPMEKLVFLEICEFAKDALKGVQIEITYPTKTNTENARIR